MDGKMTEKQLRQRKMLAAAPLVVVPLLALAFHGFGGGRGTAAKDAKPASKGLNMSLPEARFDPKKKALNKLGFYSQAEMDSAKLVEQRRSDPYARHPDPDSAVRRGWLSVRPADTGWRRALVPGQVLLGHGRSETDAKADDLMGKLEKLKEVLRNQEERAPAAAPTVPIRPPSVREQPLRIVRGGGDPDLDKLNDMLDKVLRIQHPETVAPDSLPSPVGSSRRMVSVLSPVVVGRQGADTGQVLGVVHIPDPGGRNEDEEDGLGSGFMDIDGQVAGDSTAETTVRAVVARDQTMVSGASVELRLDQNAVVGGRVIPRGSAVWGRATLNGERAIVAVTSVRLGADVVPLNMEVFDLDGMAGIRVDGSINRDAAKAAAGEAIGTAGMSTFDPSVAGQATAAGLEAIRTLASRKVRLVRFSFRAGYMVLLKNNKTINR